LGSGCFAAGIERGENILDFAVYRKAASRGLGEDHLAIDEHVELPSFAGLDFGVLAEALVDRGSQTGRARLVASSRAVEDFGGHPGFSPY